MPAAVVFVDVVGSTVLVAASDPWVVRRRTMRFSDVVLGSIATHGGRVEKRAGNAVMAVFGVPPAPEEDAERAVRAALDIRAAVRELGLDSVVGVEAGEVVFEDADSSFLRGPAVNIADRLRQVAKPNEILVGPGARRLAAHAFELEPAGTRSLRGSADPVPVWRAVRASDDRGRSAGVLSAPLIGRKADLALLENTCRRTVRDCRPHLVTIYGEPGVGKSRLAREFVAGLENTTVLVGRCLPYGEGITYWPLAEMVKASAGIADDDPPEQAREKLLARCEDEAVADLLALVSGVVEGGGERSQQEITWAGREWAKRLASEQPLVLCFEDIHWAEEPLLNLIEHLAGRVPDAPLLILCVARPELLEANPCWGGGRPRGATIELGDLAPDDAEELVDVLLADGSLPTDLRADVLATTEGNPLFVEEMIRMLAEGADERMPIPDTIQALVTTRIDALPTDAKLVLQRAAVVGRVFWEGALVHLSGGAGDLHAALETLLVRDFIQRESHSSISGEQAFRFKHILIRETAYSGLAKSARAELHAAFAAWLRGRGVEELVEIHAYHLDRAAILLTELDGSPPRELAREAAAAVEAAGVRALAREANRSGRNLLLRAVELESTLERRYQAARAAWRLDDLPAVALEMERVRSDAHKAGDRRIEGRSLIVLGEVIAFRDSDSPRSRRLIEEGLALLEPDDTIGRFDALRQLSLLARWEGDRVTARRFAQQALDVSRETGRKDLMSSAANGLASAFVSDLELERAEGLATEALRLAEESGGIMARGQALHLLANVADIRDEPEAAQLYEQALAQFAEAGAVLDHARCLNHLAELLMTRGDEDGAERLAREAVRMLGPLGDRGYLCESERILAEVLVRKGKLEEAERYAQKALKTVGPQDVNSLATTRMTLGVVRAAQGRDDEAETLLREAVDQAAARTPPWTQAATLRHLREFLRARGRADEAAELDSLIELPLRAG